MKTKLPQLKMLVVLLSFMLITITSCSKDDDPITDEDETDVEVEEDQSDAKEILSFVFTTEDNSELSESLEATINEDDKTIVAEFPFGTDITALVPTIEISELASIDKEGAQDFSEAVSYIITAEDESTQTYVTNISVNQAPNAFDLLAPEDEVTEVSILPALTWEEATDIDGDDVTYSLYLGTEEDPTIVYAENITTTSFTVTEPLDIAETYYWKIEATDGKEIVQSTHVFSFTTKDVDFENSTVVTENATFSERYTHTSVVFDNKMWVIGGFDDDELNDVWYSEDGITWTQATSNAAFSPRFRHSSVVFDDKMWVIGGTDGSILNDVWYSEDGVTWIEATSNAAFDKRAGHTSVVFDDKIWVIGGYDSDPNSLKDVWYSEDGVTWTEATANAAFGNKYAHTSVVFDNKMWVIAGVDGAWSDDVFYSTDGVTWTLATANPGFSTRAYPSSLVYGNRMWVITGDRDANDVWYSEDGISWTEATNDAAFSARLGHTSLVFDNKIWVIGGSASEYVNDVWAFGVE